MCEFRQITHSLITLSQISIARFITLALSTAQRTSSEERSSARLDVSESCIGTPSGVQSGGSFVTGSTGGGESGKDSVAAAVMRLVLPTPSSPMTQIRTGCLLALSISRELTFRYRL